MIRRRHFLLNSALAALGTTFVRPGQIFAVTAAERDALLNQRGPLLLKGKPDDLKLTPADAGVLSFISGFSNRAIFTGGCVAGKSAGGNFRVTQIVAQVESIERYQALMTKTGALGGDGMSIGNSICFNYQQTTFEVEALFPDLFKKRLLDIQRGARPDGSLMVYAHEALVYEPATKGLIDNYKAFSGKVAALKRLRTPGGYEDLSQGSLDTSCCRLTGSARDQSDLNTLLARTPANVAESRLVTTAFLQSLSLASQLGTSTDLQTRCGTRLLRAATQAVLGCDSLRVAANFAPMRARFSATEFTDGAIWHAIFQASERPTDSKPKAANLALGGRGKLGTFLTMQELQKGRKIKEDKGFRVNA